MIAARPHIYNHNLETVRRLTPSVRHRATYDRSLHVLGEVKRKAGAAIYTKSGMMLGLGRDGTGSRAGDAGFARVRVRHPSRWASICSRPCSICRWWEFVSPEQFAKYKAAAEGLGFVHVASGPMVRSSYHADEFSIP